MRFVPCGWKGVGGLPKRIGGLAKGYVGQFIAVAPVGATLTFSPHQENVLIPSTELADPNRRSTVTETQSALSGVLHGIRVLDFGRYIAGPYCAALLADLGADVVRIERREGGEDRWVAPVAADGAGALYLAMNRNKRGMTLDPAHPQGREIVQKLVATADVVVANLPPEAAGVVSFHAYVRDDFPEHPLATGCNWLQRQQIISADLQKYPEIAGIRCIFSRRPSPACAL